MRKQYWSCTKFADWLRGTKKPEAETGKGWNDWNKTAKQQHPIRYWLAEECLDKVQAFIWWPLDKVYNIKYYINNRWVTKTHALTAKPHNINRGQWCDLGNRFLPCLFDELVDFVEVECAWHNINWDKQARAKYDPPFYAWGWFRWRTWRSAQSGLDYLNWAANLTVDETWGAQPGDENYGQPTRQSESAKEILVLYKWWTEVYPKRPDPHEVSGWTEFCSRRREDGERFFSLEDRTDEERDESKRMLDIMNNIEQQYEQEDTEMMIRLIRVRHALWT